MVLVRRRVDRVVFWDWREVEEIAILIREGYLRQE